VWVLYRTLDASSNFVAIAPSQNVKVRGQGIVNVGCMTTCNNCLLRKKYRYNSVSIVTEFWVVQRGLGLMAQTDLFCHSVQFWIHLNTTFIVHQFIKQLQNLILYSDHIQACIKKKE